MEMKIMKLILNLIILVVTFNCQFTESFLLKTILNDPLTKINVYFYYGEKNQESTKVQLKDIQQILSDPNFDITKKTTLYVHGYNETQDYASTPHIREAYSYRQDHNLLTLDYNAFVNGDYFSAASSLPYFTPYVARSLNELFDNGLPIEKFHIVSHSLGCQVSGYIGRTLKQITDGSKVIERITGLDPAFPLFYIVQLFQHISENDAKFVDIIHTDAYKYGAPFPTGTVDFWPNNGKSLQPGCPERMLGAMNDNDYCSHWKSWMFWAESVSNLYGNEFIGYKTSGFSSGASETAIMGLDAPTNINGNYYLSTNPAQPFAQATAK